MLPLPQRLLRWAVNAGYLVQSRSCLGTLMGRLSHSSRDCCHGEVRLDGPGSAGAVLGLSLQSA